MMRLTPAENNKAIAAIILIILIAASGCVDFKKKEQPQGQTGNSPSNQNPTDIKPVNPEPLVLPPKIETKKTMVRPYLCNNSLIVEQVEPIFGEYHEIAKAGSRPGVFYGNADCFIHKSGETTNENLIVFNITEMPDEEQAAERLENEKSIWFGQFPNAKKEDSPVGKKSYLLIKESGGEATYSIIIVDPDVKTVFIEAKNLKPIDKKKLVEFAAAIEKLV